MVAKRFREMYGLGMTWTLVGAKFGLSAGMALRVARDGYMPSDRAERLRLRRAVAMDYDAWKARNAGKLEAIVCWAIDTAAATGV